MATEDDSGDDPQPTGRLVLDTHELGRRPGRQRRVQRTVDAPPGLGIDVMSAPEGDDLLLDVRLEAVMEGVLATGTARVGVVGECVRCLDRIESDVEVEFSELYVYPDRVEPTDEPDEIPRLQGERLDLEPVVRDAVVLALPFRPMCSPDCPGLCPRCGVRWADDPEHEHDPDTDPRWSALAALRRDEPNGSDGSTTNNEGA